MYLTNLKLNKYRNYDQLNVDFSAHINIIVGENAQGKTNLIEAIYYLSSAKTYRIARDNQLAKWNDNFFSILGELANKNGKVVINVQYQNKDGQNNKEIKINGLKIKRLADLLGNAMVVLFAPEDLNIIKGSPVERRKLLDHDISQVSSSYYIKLQKFNRLLTQRNALLKKIGSRNAKKEELQVWNEQLVDIGSDIIIKRLEVLEKLVPLTRLMQRKLTKGQENLDIKYLLNRQKKLKKHDNIKLLLLEELDKIAEEEIRRGITLWGPHRDDLLILLNGNNLKLYGSQGQHRTSVLAIKLAELEFFKAESGEYPILLLDDVLSELDSQRKNMLLNTIQERCIQCFITTTEDLDYLWDDRTCIKKFNISNGYLIQP